MTEDQLKQEIRALAIEEINFWDLHSEIESAHLGQTIDRLAELCIRFSDQRVKAEYKSLIEMVIPIGDMKYHRYAVPVQTLAKRLQELQGSGAVTPPVDSADGNARVSGYLPGDKVYSKYFNAELTITHIKSDEDWWFTHPQTGEEVKARTPLSYFRDTAKQAKEEQ